MTEEVLIDFKVDYSELTTAQEQLAKGGKIDTKSFDAVNKSISATSIETKGLIKQFKDVATTATKMGKSVEAAFGAGIQDALDEAGVSAEEFAASLQQANAPTKSLKQELKELKEALALAKANGQDTGAEFERMRARAGALSDAIADAGAEIKNAGSDTRNLDNVVGSISALAGGFAAAQGAAALFGDENEDVQKALLKVNSAMAIASGIQQLYNATLKEGALTKLVDSVRTGAQTAAQTIYTVAVGSSTGALKAFRIALLATGIGAVIALLVLAAQAMGAFGDSTADATEDLKAQQEAAENLVSSLEDISGAAASARAAQAGGSDEIKRQIELAKARGNNAQQVFNLEQSLRQQEIKELRVLGQTYATEYQTRKRLGQLTGADAEALSAKIIEINRAGQDKANEIVASGIEFERTQREKAAKESKEANDKRIAANRAARLAELNDALALAELNVLAAQKGSDIELDAKKKVIQAKRNLELAAEKLTINQIALIRAQALDAQLQLQKDFNDKATETQLQGQIAVNNAALEALNITNDERLRLQSENIEATAQLEINAAEGNATAILLIEAKKISDLRALRNAAIQKDLADTLQANAGITTAVRNQLESIATDSKKSAESRIEAIRSIERQELDTLQQRIDANEKLEQSDADYNANVDKLSLERIDIEDRANSRIDQIYEDSAEKRNAAILSTVQTTLEVAGQIADFFSNLNQLQSDQEQNRIAEQRRVLDELLAAGAITEKEAEKRAKQIEILERQAKQRQAQREKQEAVFRALLAIPSAVLQGLSQGGPVLAAIYGALAAAQAALVIARPVPKFFRGKRPGTFEGEGIVGDMGPELAIQGGRARLYTDPTQTYLGRNDTVFTAAQTRQILHNTNIQAASSTGGSTQERFDYDRLAKAIPAAGLHVNIDKDGITSWTANELAAKTTFDKRYRS